ncbi:MAG: MBL fold metallo-hydrolase [Myxococcota bacterium]
MDPIDLSLCGQRIRALSIGGVETCFQLSAFDACLDIGRCPPGASNQGNLLLTHGHIDHAAGLPYYISMRSMARQPAPRIYCPAPALPAVRMLLEAWTQLQADTELATLTGVGPGEEIPLRGGFARTFHTPHRIESIGYTLYRRRKRLRAHLVGSSGEELAARVRAGEDVNEEHTVAEICFPGDTEITVVEQEECVRTAQVLLLECTFLGPSVRPSDATEGGHVHLDQIAERAHLFQNEALVLTHFSRRHSPEEIRAEVHEKLPPELLARTQLLIHGGG